MTTAPALGDAVEGPKCWSLRLLGGFELSALPGGEKVASLGKRERVLLAYLALSPNFRQARRKLATLLWGDSADETALDNLRTSLWRLRKAIGDTDQFFVASEATDIVLNATAFDIDAVTFRRLAALSGRTELEDAATLYAGALLDGLSIETDEFESWRRDEATRCRDQALDVQTRLMTQLIEAGDTERAIDTGLAILRLERLHEPTVRSLMRLYAGSGRRGAAVQMYRTFSDALRADLDAQPEGETRRIFAELARGDEEQGNAVETKALPYTTAARLSDEPRAASDPIESGNRWLWPSFRWRWHSTIVAAMAIVAIVLISYRPFAVLDSSKSAVADQAPSTPQASAVSIAVLPFTNLSGDASQDYFSDGITEEVTAALAKVRDLKVVARTSAFQFKGQNQDIRMVAHSLGASHLLEGSVRKDGNRVRISAQLIDANTGTHLWAENYDREFSDIFVIQEDIAEAIAAALHVPLGLKPGDGLVSNRTKDVASYQQYLRASALVRARGLTRMTDASALLEQVVARDSGFAPAWAMLAQAYEFTPTYHPARNSGAVEEYRRVVDASLPKAEAAARRSIQLDPNIPSGYLSLAYVEAVRGTPLSAEELYLKALALDPNNPDALHLYGLLLAETGRLKEALAMRQRLQAQEPFVPVFNAITALVLWLNGQNDAAIAMLKDLPAGGGGEAPLAMIYAAGGRYSEAADLLLPSTNTLYLPGTVADAARLLRTAPASAGAAQSLPRLGNLAWVYIYVGAPSRAFEFYDANSEASFFLGGITAPLWHASYASVRQTERFKAYARAAGMVNYWRAKGWADLCRPVGNDDFVCD